MASSQSFLPDTDAGLLAWSSNFSTLINAAAATYGLSVQQATNYAALDQAYSDSYQAATDPITRTRGKVAAKNNARTALKKNAGLLASVIEGQGTVTDEQKINLGLNVRAQPTPIPPPAFPPALDIVSVTGFTVRIKLHDSTSSRRGRPFGAAGAAVFSFIGAEAPTDPSAWEFQGNTSKRIVDVTFGTTLAAGAKIWLKAFWFNARGEGPSCAPVGTNLQGGVSMAA